HVDGASDPPGPRDSVPSTPTLPFPRAARPMLFTPHRGIGTDLNRSHATPPVFSGPAIYHPTPSPSSPLQIKSQKGNQSSEPTTRSHHNFEIPPACLQETSAEKEMEAAVGGSWTRVRTLGRGASGAVVSLAADDLSGALFAVKSAPA
uniref:Protein kinase domain-containing protein n=1 Tax=Aegilops tauschii subsp. strangulata TaxID=200361 RepID=A0A453F9Y4_AEGTS